MAGPARTTMPDRKRTTGRDTDRRGNPKEDPNTEIYADLDETTEEDDLDEEEDEGHLEEVEDPSEEDAAEEVDTPDEDEDADEDSYLEPVALWFEADDGSLHRRPARIAVCDSEWGAIAIAQGQVNPPRSARGLEKMAKYLHALRSTAEKAARKPRQLCVADVAGELEDSLGSAGAREQLLSSYLDRGERVELPDRVVRLGEILRKGVVGPKRGELSQAIMIFLRELPEAELKARKHGKYAELGRKFSEEMARRRDSRFKEVKPRTISMAVKRTLEKLGVVTGRDEASARRASKPANHRSGNR